MHDLPKDLTNSLRSYRGSIYGSVRREPSDVDLEKGKEDYGEKGQTLSPAQSSVILHPSASSRSLRQIMRLGRSQPQPDQLQSQTEPQQQRIQVQTQQNTDQNADTIHSSPKMTTKRQATFQHPPQTPASAKLSLFHGPKIDDPDPASDRLDDDLTPLTAAHFYELIGMRAPDQSTGQIPKDIALPRGLYNTIRTRMRYVQLKYRIFDVATYVFLALQLLLSAVFIVLGSIRSDYHIAIAVLGAISAVISGIMSLMKGQGLPNRLRQVRDDLQNVMFAAEELYWDVQAGRSVLFKDIVKIRENYLRVIAEARKNHPDSWTKGADDIATGINVQSRGSTTIKTAAPKAK